MARLGSSGADRSSGTEASFARASREGTTGALRGGVVTGTGFVLAHEGEMITPVLGSEAEVQLAYDDSRMAININLPVIVEVVGRRDGNEVEQTIEETLRRLRHAIEAQPS